MATQVPYTGTPEVAATDTPIPSRSGDAPLSAFGGASAAATQHLGETLQRSGKELFERAYSMQTLDQANDALMAGADASNKTADLEVKFRSLEGKAASDAYEQFKIDVNKVREEAGTNLKSDYARKLYLQDTRNLQQRAVMSAGIHAGIEFKKSIIGGAEGSAEAKDNIAAANPKDEGAFQDAVDAWKQGSGVIGGSKAWTDDVKNDYVTQKVANLVGRRAESLMLSEPVAAKKLLADAVEKGLITPDLAGKIQDKIQNRIDHVTVRQETAGLYAGEGFNFGDVKQPVQKLVMAIGGVESSQSWNPGPGRYTTNDQGQYGHPLGRFGIMSYNLKPWLKEAGMPDMTEEKFVENTTEGHRAQLQLATFEINKLYEKYGTANEVFRHWRGLGWKDKAFGETEPQYLAKANKQLVNGASGSELADIAQKRAERLAPGDTEFSLKLKDSVEAEHSKQLRINREDDYNRQEIVLNAMKPGADGKSKGGVDELSPEGQTAFWGMTEHQQATVRNAMAQNAKGGYIATPENQKDFRTWKGMVGSQDPKDVKAILDEDFQGKPWPIADIDYMMQARRKVLNGVAQNPNVDHAMQVLKETFGEKLVNSKMPKDYNLLRGTMQELMEKRIRDTGNQLKDEEIKELGRFALRPEVDKGVIWNGTTQLYKMPVDPDAKKEIIQKFKQSHGGVDPSDRDINRAWTALQFHLYQKGKTLE